MVGTAHAHITAETTDKGGRFMTDAKEIVAGDGITIAFMASTAEKSTTEKT
jgi:hypothetical protein